jgi:hypothetical protein
MEKKYLFLLVWLIVSLSLIGLVSSLNATLPGQKPQVSENIEEAGYGSYLWEALTPIIAILALFVLIGIALKYSGMGEVLANIQHFFRSVLDIIRTVFESMVHSAPGFIKIVFFILLFWIFGALIYSWTLGLAVVCNEKGEVYKGDIPAGIIYNFLPAQNPSSETTAQRLLQERGFHQENFDYFLVNQNITGFLVPQDYSGRYVDYVENGIYSGWFCIAYDKTYNYNYPTASNPNSCVWRFRYAAKENVKGVYDVVLMVGYPKISFTTLMLNPLYIAAKKVQLTNTSKRICVDSSTAKCLNVELTNYEGLEMVVEKGICPFCYDIVAKGVPRVIRTGQTVATCNSLLPTACRLLRPSEDKNITTKRSTFRDRFFDLDTDNDGLISYGCDCKSSDQDPCEEANYSDKENLLLLGIPIFDRTVMMLLVAAVTLMGIVSYFKR